MKVFQRQNYKPFLLDEVLLSNLLPVLLDVDFCLLVAVGFPSFFAANNHDGNFRDFPLDDEDVTSGIGGVAIFCSSPRAHLLLSDVVSSTLSSLGALVVPFIEFILTVNTSSSMLWWRREI
jgi:hypothetical protein